MIAGMGWRRWGAIGALLVAASATGGCGATGSASGEIAGFAAGE